MNPNTKTNILKTIKSYLVITLGVVITAAGIYFFELPNHFSTGGVSGISVILSGIFPDISFSIFIAVLNMLLLAIGLIVLGRAFTFKTIYVSVLVSGVMALFEHFFPMSAPFTDEKMLELIFSVFLVSGGCALLFSERASSGGTDIVAMILKKYTSLNTGKALLCTDFLITVAACFVFGIETGLYSMLGLIAKAFIVDNFIDSIFSSKQLSIVTAKADVICDYITGPLERSATVLDCIGTYTGQPRKMVITVLSRAQAVELKNYIKTIDPDAFTITSNSSDILGNGFRENVG